MSPWAELKQEAISEGFGEEISLKRAFAKASLYNPDNSFQAALAVFGYDTGRAMRASSEWPNDPEVIKEKERLITEHGSLHFLPDKAAIARRVIGIAEEAKTTQERLLSYRLYADLMGMIEKPGVQSSNTNVFMGSNKVMLVKHSGSDAEWQERAANQQALLVQQASEDIGSDDDEVVE